MAGVVGPIALADARAIADMMVLCERAPVASQWVESLVIRTEDDVTRAMLDALI